MPHAVSRLSGLFVFAVNALSVLTMGAFVTELTTDLVCYDLSVID